MAIFTVIGIYEDNYQPYFDYVEAKSPAEAARVTRDLIEGRGGHLIVAGVVDGDHVVHEIPGDARE